MTTIKTRHLKLRALTENDLPRLVMLLGEWEVTKWRVMLPFPFQRSDAEKLLSAAQEADDKGRPSFYAVCGLESNQLIGGIEIHEKHDDPANDGTLEIGYWLGLDYWACGYMTEALEGLLPSLFQRPNAQRLIGLTNPANQASQNVLIKTGFAYEGIRPRTKEGRLRGSAEVAVWVLTREAFFKSHPAS